MNALTMLGSALGTVALFASIVYYREVSRRARALRRKYEACRCLVCRGGESR